jgi:hypothetical protein
VPISMTVESSTYPFHLANQPWINASLTGNLFIALSKYMSLFMDYYLPVNELSAHHESISHVTD